MIASVVSVWFISVFVTQQVKYHIFLKMDCNRMCMAILFSVTCMCLIVTVTAKHRQARFDSGQINSISDKAFKQSVVAQTLNIPHRHLVPHRFIKRPNSTVLVQQRHWIRQRNRQPNWRQRFAERRRQALRRHFHTHVVDQNGRVLGISQGVAIKDVRPTQMVARLTIPISTGPQVTMVTSDVHPVPTVPKQLVPVSVQRPGQLVGKPFLGTDPSISPTQADVTSTQEVRQVRIDKTLLDKTAMRQPNPQPLTDLQDGNLSILRLLNDRQPIIKDKEDEAKLKKHLLTISRMEKANDLIATDQRLIRMQLEYIYTIQEAPIKREVLKLFVKDIVEKSGFLTASQQSNGDVAEMASLFELIKSISANNSTPIFPSTAAPEIIPLSRKINVGLDINNYRRPEKTPEQVPGINLNHLVGLSVYGDRPGRQTGKQSGSQTGSQIERPNGGRKIAVTTTTIPSTTFEPLLEPLGGNDAYWTHLSVGFQDMLCALCQRQNKQTCINKYCQNDENS